MSSCETCEDRAVVLIDDRTAQRCPACAGGPPLPAATASGENVVDLDVRRQAREVAS